MFNRIVPSWWWRIKMMKAYVAGDYSDAIEFAKRILNRKAWDVSALWAIADCYRLQENYDQAIEYAEKVLVSDPQHIDTLQLLSALYFERGDYHSAYGYVCRGISVLEKVDGALGKTIDAVARSPTSPTVSDRPVRAIHRVIADDRAVMKEWLEWGAQFKAWYEALDHSK